MERLTTSLLPFNKLISSLHSTLAFFLYYKGRLIRYDIMAKNSKKNKDKEKDTLTPILDEPKGPEFDDSSDDNKDIADAIEQAKNDGWNQDTQSFFERNKGTIFPFIIFVIIIVVAVVAITVINDDDSNEDPVQVEEQKGDDNDTDSDKNQSTDPGSQDNGDTQDTIDTTNPTAPTGSQTPSPPEPEISPPVPNVPAEWVEYTQPTQVGDMVMVSAQQGDGITHLARKSLMYWLEQNGESLTDEQRVYAEDYIQNQTGTHWLEIGQTLSFDNDLIQEAFNAAQGLQDWQLDNLSQYT